MDTADVMDQHAFEGNAHRNLQELSSLVAESDQQAQASEVGQFSNVDPLENITIVTFLRCLIKDQDSNKLEISINHSLFHSNGLKPWSVFLMKPHFLIHFG